MERRFAFVYYEEFDQIERVAKKARTGLWMDDEVRKEIQKDIVEEKELYQQMLELEFLEEQEVYLDELQKEEGVLQTLSEVTKGFSTFRVSQRKDTSIRVAGQTWG
mgnify:FL=1